VSLYIHLQTRFQSCFAELAIMQADTDADTDTDTGTDTNTDIDTKTDTKMDTHTYTDMDRHIMLQTHTIYTDAEHLQI